VHGGDCSGNVVLVQGKQMAYETDMTKGEARGAAFQAGPGMRVTVSYRLFDAEGELVEESAPQDVLPLLLGYGQAPAKIETALAGASGGETRRVTLRPREAFGSRDPSLILELARDEFPAELAVGDELEAEDASGQPVPLKIVDLDDERVVADTNHPLAGQEITLELHLAAVRPATAEEIAQATERLERPLPEDSAAELLPVAALLRHRSGPGPGATQGHLPQGANDGRSSAESSRVQSSNGPSPISNGHAGGGNGSDSGSGKRGTSS
jgi:FKBP-type peptidyl-prolyl cis-trans isomerase 2